MAEGHGLDDAVWRSRAAHHGSWKRHPYVDLLFANLGSYVAPALKEYQDVLWEVKETAMILNTSQIECRLFEINIRLEQTPNFP